MSNVRENKEQSPVIRFAGFNDDWVQRKFKNFISKSGPRNKNGEFTEAYSVSNTLGLVKQSDQFDGSRLDSLDKKDYKIVQPDEFAYNPARINVGSIAFNNLNKPVIVSSLYVIVKMSDNLNDQFVLQWLKSPEFNYEVIRNTEGSVREYLFYENFANVRLPYTPNYDEQVKIGEFLGKLDDLIAANQQKDMKLRDVKKLLLQKMFVSGDATEPEIRFAGFNDDWVQRELNQVAPVTMGTSPKSENYTENPDDHILVQGNADMNNGFVSPRVWTTQVTKTAGAGDLILSVRAPVGEVGKTAYDVVLGRGVAGIKGNEFIFQSLKQVQSKGYWARMSSGSTFDSVTSEEVKTLPILVPDESEQELIGKFLGQMDDLIAANQNKGEKLRNTKKLLLQEMFV
jgi:type I restriction enzyme S subunit